MPITNTINIYYDGENYYYREKTPLNKKDKLIEFNVSLEAAFDYCHKRNFENKDEVVITKSVYERKQLKHFMPYKIANLKYSKKGMEPLQVMNKKLFAE